MALRLTGRFSGPKGLAVENRVIFLDMCWSTISSGYPLSSKIFLIKSISLYNQSLYQKDLA